MKFYDVIVFVHVLSAVTLVGGGLLATPAVSAGIRRARTVAELRRWLTLGRPLGRINPISSMTLLASGAYLSSVSNWWGAAWVQVAVVLWATNTLMAATIQNPSMKALAQGAFTSQDDWIGPDLERLQKAPRMALIHGVMLANDVGVLFLMVTKPTSYLVAVLAIVGAQLIMFGISARHRQPEVGQNEPIVPSTAETP